MENHGNHLIRYLKLITNIVIVILYIKINKEEENKIMHQNNILLSKMMDI